MAEQMWQPPLPPGWEARWDPNQRAFFFINHSNKSTSWDDPRWGNKQQTQRGETTFTDQSQVDIEAIVVRLRSRFPDAGAVIKDIVTMCGNDEDDAANQLLELGFKSSETRSPQRSTPQSHGSGSRSRTTSPQRGKTSTTTSPQRAAAVSPQRAAPPQIPDVEKRRRKIKLCAEFSSLEPKVVQMALEACHYDEEKTRGTLSRVAGKWQSSSSSSDSRPGTASSTASSASSRPFSPKFNAGAASLEPVAFSITPDERVSSAVGSERYRPSTAVTSGGRKATAGSSGISGQQRHQHQHRAKHVTKMSEQLLTTTNDLLNHLASTSACCPDNQHSPVHSPKHSHSPSPSSSPVGSVREGGHQKDSGRQVVTSQPQPQPRGRASQSQPQPQGRASQPRPPAQHTGSALAHGPDPSVHVGHDRYLQAGPDPTLLLGGSDGADGPNPEYYQGTNPEYHHGNVPDLAAGACGAFGHNPTLRCADEHPRLADMGQRYMQTSI
ncbi:E3 ubiquitin-protein ligase Smurf1-like isoform X2 [Littorina saxatilis]|uniref:E3 ubiquitin-protein ligase Smurf1-like isoform X2 n=1 Tax=Littorina saxatilis TaxID=31220 RepID=UPI0038B4AB1D